MKRGDLVWAYIAGNRVMCIVDRMDPAYPDENTMRTSEDYYYIIPLPGEAAKALNLNAGIPRRWIRSDLLELINEV